MDVLLPEYLYKYHPLESKFEEMIVRDGVQLPKTGIDALEDMLLLGKIYYSKPYYFNDPFELDGVRLRLSAGEMEQGVNLHPKVPQVLHPKLPHPESLIMA